MEAFAPAPRLENAQETPSRTAPGNDGSRSKLASWTQETWNKAATNAIVLTIIGVVADAIFAATVLKLLVENSVMAYISAVAAVTMASAAAYFAGTIIHHSSKKAWGWVLLGAWALVGGGLAVIRIMHSKIAVPTTPDGATPEEIDRIIQNAFLSDLGIGALMLVIFAATGILLIIKAKDLSDPDLALMLQGLKTRDELLKVWTEVDSRAVKEENLLARRNYQITVTLPKERLNAHEGAETVREVKKEISVITQAEILARPEATGMTLVPRNPRPYRPTAQRPATGTGPTKENQ